MDEARRGISKRLGSGALASLGEEEHEGTEQQQDRARHFGLNVVVVSRPQSLSRSLASYADFVIEMPELEFAA